MQNKYRGFVRRGASVLPLFAAPALSFAAVDVTAVTAAGADVTTVGTAVFGVIVLAMVWKWIRRAL